MLFQKIGMGLLPRAVVRSCPGNGLLSFAKNCSPGSSGSPTFGKPQATDGFMAITGIDAEYMSDCEIMIGSLDYPDLISATHIALDGGSCRGLKSGEAPCRRRLLSARSCIRGFDLDIKLARVRAAICGR